MILVFDVSNVFHFSIRKSSIFSEFDIYIDGTKIDYAKSFKFSKAGLHTVEFKIYENLSMDEMFRDLSTITTIEMNSNKNCQISSMKNAFRNCENMVKFDFSGFDTSVMTSIRGMFANCKKLEKINLGDMKTNSVTDMSYLFQNNYVVTSIDLSKFNS